MSKLKVLLPCALAALVAVLVLCSGTEAVNRRARLGTATTASPKGSSTSTSASPASASSSTVASSAVKVALEAAEGADDDAMKKMMDLQRKEAKLVEKVIEDIREWVAWLLSHDRRTLNKTRALMLIEYVERKLKPFIDNSFDYTQTQAM